MSEVQRQYEEATLRMERAWELFNVEESLHDRLLTRWDANLKATPPLLSNSFVLVLHRLDDDIQEACYSVAHEVLKFVISSPMTNLRVNVAPAEDNLFAFEVTVFSDARVDTKLNAHPYLPDAWVWSDTSDIEATARKLEHQIVDILDPDPVFEPRF